jgi:hypothetical protein
VKEEFAALRELSETSAKRDQILSSCDAGRSHQFFAGVVDAFAMKPEAIILIGLQQELKVFSNIFGQTLEYLLRLFVGQWAHLELKTFFKRGQIRTKRYDQRPLTAFKQRPYKAAKYLSSKATIQTSNVQTKRRNPLGEG